MIKSKVSAAIAAIGLSLGLVGAADALTIQSGDFILILQNLDSATTGYGDTPGVKCSSVLGCDAAASSKAVGSVGSVNSSADTMGIFTIQSITRVGSLAPYFTAGGADGFLTGIFGGLMDRQISVADNNGVGSCTVLTPGGCTTTARAVGGAFSIYRNAVAPNTLLGPAVAPGKDLNALLYPTISNTGSLFLSGIFGTGVIFGDSISTFNATFNNGTIGGGSLGYLDVTGGSAASIFHTKAEFDPNGGAHDAVATFTFAAAQGDAATAGWNVISSAQVIGRVVPEPGSLALVALALLGVGTISRRSKKA